MHLIRLGGVDTLADCGRRIAASRARGFNVPFIVCDECAGDFAAVIELARDYRARRMEWDGG